jgi:signal transduction histidine kinase
MAHSDEPRTEAHVSSMALVVGPALIIVLLSVALSAVLVTRHVGQIRAGLLGRAETVAQFMSRDAVVGVLSYDHVTLRHLASLAATQDDILYAALLGENGTEIARRGEMPPKRSTLGPATPMGTRGLQLLPFARGWELRAPLYASAIEPRGGASGESATSFRPGTRKLIGQIRLGISRDRLDSERRMAVLTALAFTVTVTLLAIAGAIVLVRRNFAALMTSASLAEEREHVAELKARIVTQTSHEFRTPLAVLVSASDVLQRYGDRLTTEQRNSRIEKIRGAVRQMTDLLDDVLMFGRTDASRFAPLPTDLVDLCRTAIELARAGLPQNLQLCAILPGSAVEASVDSFLLGQVLRNLLSNAIKYSPAGGTVTLQLDARADAVRFRVSDEGIGIPADDLPHLFEPFQRGANTGKIPGSGLGLAIAKRAVDAHHGAVEATNGPGGGAVFTVTLPASCLRGRDRSAA